MSPELLGLGPDHTNHFNLLRLNRPGHAGNIGRYAAIHFALEALDDLRPADIPPLLGGGHLLARVRPEDFRNHGEGIGLAFVVVGGVRTLFVSVEPATDGLDAQLVQHVLVVLLSSESNRLLRIGSCEKQAAGQQKEDLFHIRWFYVSQR